MGIFEHLFSRESFDKNVETHQDAEQSARMIKCSGCGATNLISDDGECEYCGSPLKYVADNKMASAAATGDSEKAAEQNTDVADTYTLTAGFYAAGVDIPAGTCNITAVSGYGNLYSSDGELNEVFGIGPHCVPSFKGMKLPKEMSLCLYGNLTVKVVYKTVDGGFSGRTYDPAHAIELSDGNYEVGSDFKAGTYNIIAISGFGNLYSEEGDVNEVFGVEDNCVHEIKNVYLPKGAELSLEGGISVKLIPAVSV